LAFLPEAYSLAPMIRGKAIHSRKVIDGSMARMTALWDHVCMLFILDDRALNRKRQLSNIGQNFKIIFVSQNYAICGSIR
jgi:hypothetical protein